MRRLRCECGHVVELTDQQERELAGKFFACPECGTTRRLRSIEPQPMPTVPATTTGTGTHILHRAKLLIAAIRPKRRFQFRIVTCVVLLAIGLTVYVATTSRPQKATTADNSQKKRSGAKPNPPVRLPDVELLPHRERDLVEREDDRQHDRPSEERPTDAPDLTQSPALAVAKAASKLSTPKPPIAAVPAGRKPMLLDPAADEKVLATIRRLLADNLPDGEWSEVEYWPTRTLQVQPQRPLVLARLKFRAKNRFGALEVSDMIFMVEDDLVRRFDHGNDDVYRRMFDLGLRRTFDPVLSFGQSIAGLEVPKEE